MIESPITCPHCSRQFDPKPNRVFVVNCVICKKLFSTEYKTSLYCSDACWRKNPKEMARRGKERLKFRADAARVAKYNRRMSEYQRGRWKNDPLYRVKQNVRAKTRIMLKNQSLSRSKMLGCTGNDLKSHLESQFYDGMTWLNYGTHWVVDHKRPIASFNLDDPQEISAACHFSNLQPLTRRHNEEKAARLDWTKPQCST